MRILADQARSFDLLHRRSPCYNARYEVGTRWCHNPGAQPRLQSSGFHIAHAVFVRAVIRQAIFKLDKTSAPKISSISSADVPKPDPRIWS
jgi:hypothetical protein